MVKEEDALFGANEEVVTTTEEVSPPAPEPKAQPRDEAGRFAASDKGEVEAPAPAPSAPPAPVEDKHIPITALLDEREKRQRADARIAHLEAMLRSQQKPADPIDPIEQPQEFARSLYETVHREQMARHLQMSRFYAEDKFGAEAVAEAMQWYDNQPRAVSEQFLNAPSPFHAAVSYYQQHKAAEERSAPDYEARLEARLREKIMAEMASARPPASTPPPQSLASAPGSGRASPSSGGDPLFS